jgi:hypothetical protein
MMVIHKDCNPSLAKDKSLPINSYIVSYIFRDINKYDIVQAGSFVEVFDTYYDEYGKGSIQSIKWTDGRVSPKVYGYVPKDNKKKK